MATKRDGFSSMHHFRPCHRILPLSVLIALVIAGCGQSKTSQCQKLIRVINKGSTLASTLEVDRSTSTVQLVNVLNVITQELKEVEVADETIIGFQNRFISIYEQFNQAFKDTTPVVNLISNVQPTPDGLQKVKEAKTKVDGAIAKIKQATKDADALAIEINNYCNVP